MSIHRDPPFFFDVECDECGAEDRIERETFHEVIDVMKSEGWKIRRINGEWEHHCSDCAEDD